MSTGSFHFISISYIKDNIRDALTKKFSKTLDLDSAKNSLKTKRIELNQIEKHNYFEEMNMKIKNIRLNPTTIDLLAGISSGFLTGFLTTPMDVVTARLMTQKSNIAKGVILPGFRAAVGTPYKGLGDCIFRMAKEEGPRSFFMGVKSRVGWIAPFTAISLGLNNVLRRKAEEAQLLRASSFSDLKDAK